MGKKNKDNDLAAEFEEIQEEARSGFSLRDRLAGTSGLRETVTIYTDAAAGKELGHASDEDFGNGLKTGRRVRAGLVGELDALQEEGEALAKQIDAYNEADIEVPDEDAARAAEISAEMKRVRAAIASVTKRLKASSMEFTLHTLPKAIIKDVKRKSRESLGLKAKGIPEARMEEYETEYTAQMLVASTESWVDNQSGESYTKLTVEQARDLEGYLPVGQFDHLDRAMVELSIKAAIGNVATDSADF